MGVCPSACAYNFNYLEGKYDRKPDVQSLYEVIEGRGKAPFFRGVDRIKLMKSVFENNVSKGGAGLNIEKMLETGKHMYSYMYTPIHVLIHMYVQVNHTCWLFFPCMTTRS